MNRRARPLPALRRGAARPRHDPALVRREVARGLALRRARDDGPQGRRPADARQRAARGRASARGTHEVYQLPLGFRPEPWEQGVVVRGGGWAAYDALAGPRARARPATRGCAPTRPTSGFHAARDLPAATRARSVGVEQSNTSVVFDDATVLKLYRRVEPGENPELELLRFLSQRGFAHIAPLAGWWEMADARTMDATLGILQDFVADGRDGWETVLASLEARRRAPGRHPGARRRRRRAARRARIRRVRPRFAPEEPSVENLALLTATIDEEIERVFRDLPENRELEPRSPIAARRCARSCAALSTLGAAGKVIRHHGDLHLGQVLLSAAARLGDPRLRGRARPLAARAPAQALAAARRGRHAALVRLRRRGRRAPARHRGARGLGGARPRGVPRRLPRDGRPVAAAAERRRRPSSCCRSSSSRRPSTSCATSSTTGPTGSRIPVAAIVRLLEEHDGMSALRRDRRPRAPLAPRRARRPPGAQGGGAVVRVVPARRPSR